MEDSLRYRFTEASGSIEIPSTIRIFGGAKLGSMSALPGRQNQLLVDWRKVGRFVWATGFIVRDTGLRKSGGHSWDSWSIRTTSGDSIHSIALTGLFCSSSRLATNN